ncbi:MAG TPA: NAD(P)-binding protein, partial [Gemmatimonadaceae bacterium]|nr:NAD(P)-binding protein [Gemmatimonadaceae bacterium]
MSHRHPAVAPPQERGRAYQPSEEVDFVVVGSGAAGGVVAKELSRAGFSVVVLEQGPWRTERDFPHDEIKVWQQNFFTVDWNTQPN